MSIAEIKEVKRTIKLQRLGIKLNHNSVSSGSIRRNNIIPHSSLKSSSNDKLLNLSSL